MKKLGDTDFVLIYGTTPAVSRAFKLQEHAEEEAVKLSAPSSFGGEVVVLERSADRLKVREIGRARGGRFFRKGRSLGWFLAGAAVGFGTGYSAAKTSGTSSGNDWYVWEYNYKKGHPDRRLKGLQGPFSRSEAESIAKNEKSFYSEAKKGRPAGWTWGAKGRSFGWFLAGAAVGYGAAKAQQHPDKTREIASSARDRARQGFDAVRARVGRAGGQQGGKSAHEYGVRAAAEVIRKQGQARYESNLEKLRKVVRDQWDREYLAGYMQAGGFGPPPGHAAGVSYKTNDPRGWGGDPKRGAALGRPTLKGPADFSGKLTLQRVRLDSGGYDPNGTYFGTGAPLFWYASDDGEIDAVLRASDREAAKRKVSALYPKARFYR